MVTKLAFYLATSLKVRLQVKTLNKILSYHKILSLDITAIKSKCINASISISQQ